MPLGALWIVAPAHDKKETNRDSLKKYPCILQSQFCDFSSPSMDRKVNSRRATSAGYRIAERPSVALTSQSSVSIFRHPPDRTRNTGGAEASAQDADTRDPVKQDQIWREFVRAERMGVKEWEQNWGFLKNFDQLGRPRTQPSLPGYVPVYSDCLPNTTNQMFGSRLRTDLGKELMRMDKLLLLTGSHGKTKQSPEMQPC